MANSSGLHAVTFGFIALTALSAFAKVPTPMPTDPLRTPHLVGVLGPETYAPVEMTKLARPVFVYVNLDLARADGYAATTKSLTKSGLQQLTDEVAFAVPAFKETADDYTAEKIQAPATGNGGLGLNDNFGDGRSMFILRKKNRSYRAKGGGRTVFVGPTADEYHSSGGLPLSDAVREATWSNLLADELPFGAHRALTIFATGTFTTPNNKDFTARSVLVAEDPHRFGHSVINDTAERLGGAYAQRDRARIRANMKTIVEALPSPAGVSLEGKTRGEIFRLKVEEAFDRQAIQHGYLWAHRLFHGATSPANASPDGRLLDFGTMISLLGYGRVQVLDDDGASGDTTVFKKDLIKNIRDSWVKTLPKALLAYLPSEEELFERFDKKFHDTQKTELVRNAGTVDAIFAELKNRPEAKALGETLFKVAVFKNDRMEAIWEDRDSAVRNNGYDMEKILTTLSEARLESKESLEKSIGTLLADAPLRRELVSRYQTFFKIQRMLAERDGIKAGAESNYRRAAAKIRNRAMDALFRSDESNERLDSTIRKFEQTNDPKVIQAYIDSTVELSRREFHDATPYTIVLSEKRDPGTGSKVRRIFDAKLDRVIEVQPGEKVFEEKVYAEPTSKTGAAKVCRDLFRGA